MPNTSEKHPRDEGQERRREGITIWCNGQPMPPTLTVEEAASIAGCGRSAAYLQVRESRWPAVRISEHRIVICTVPFLQMLGLEIDPTPPTTESSSPEPNFLQVGPADKKSGVPDGGTPLLDPHHDQAIRDQSEVTPST